MCGIAGFIDPTHQLATEAFLPVLERMSGSLAHRGPDGSGHWHDAEVGVGVGHRRLSVIDLSDTGRQPMHSNSGRYVVVFNGEIYNFRQLRQELERRPGEFFGWKGHSDTEVLLASIEAWGLEDSLSRFNGMFAFALWDRQERILHLVRDRLGEKPLYYGLLNNVFLFASELKALREHPAWRGEIDRDALASLMRHSYIPAPHSIYRQVGKLEPGSILSIPAAGKFAGSGSWKIQRYWSLKEVAEKGSRNLFQGSDAEATLHLEALLKDSIRLRMESDVPLGAFLSGGIDSSLVVAIMQRQADRPVQTFSVGFREKSYNEAGFARKVAAHLGTDHTEIEVTPQEIMEVIPRLPILYDEPFADPSQMPTFLISRLARQKVVVSLSGDGGDELFGGYNRYYWGRNIWRWIGWVPSGLREKLGRNLALLSPQAWDRLFGVIGRPFSKFVPIQPGHKLHVLAEVLAANSPDQLYRALVSHWKDPTSVVLGSVEPSTPLTDSGWAPNLADFTQRMMFFDSVSYMPDDILVKVDRASMGASLEVRVPFLDHRVLEMAWKFPLSMKVRGNQGKWILRQILDQYVPRHMVERPKMGFGVPLDAWLRGPLREWAEGHLNEERLHREGFFNPALIRRKWEEHLAGRRNWQYYLWDILTFQAWLETQ